MEEGGGWGLRRNGKYGVACFAMLSNACNLHRVAQQQVSYIEAQHAVQRRLMRVRVTEVNEFEALPSPS